MRWPTATAPALTLFVLAVMLAPRAMPAWAASQETRPKQAERRWLERLSKLDRVLIDDLVGFAPPGFSADLTWIGNERLTWEALRGKVVVLQSWTSGTNSGRKLLGRTEKLLEPHDASDVQAILLHTPVHTDRLQPLLDRRPTELTVVMDASGAYCDDLGFYKRSVNIVVDRAGTVRYAGLSARGLKAAMAQLLDEPFDPKEVPKVRPKVERSVPVEYPPVAGRVLDARDVRGERAPEFFIDDWITDQPDPEGKVAMIVFWRTSDPLGVTTIPHLNDLADRFREDVVIVGISPESISKLRRFMETTEVRFSVASDRSEVVTDETTKMKDALDSESWPHCIVMSADWIVRWQGIPTGLSGKTLEKIARANRSRIDTKVETKRPRRWTQP